ncbi:MAG: lytic transglycosylase domain-containing protein [Novosphingobium sp.]
MRIAKHLLLLSILGITHPASAQVFEVRPGHAMQVRDGGGAVVWRDAVRREQSTAQTASVAGTEIALAAASNSAGLLAQVSARYSLSPALLEALVWQESRWHHDAISPKGAVGLTQLMPATARELGVDPHDPIANLDGGARYLRLMLDHFNGDVVKALAAYNAGMNRVERANGVPAIRETQGYVAAIIARLNSHVR